MCSASFQNITTLRIIRLPESWESLTQPSLAGASFELAKLQAQFRGRNLNVVRTFIIVSFGNILSQVKIYLEN